MKVNKYKEYFNAGITTLELYYERSTNTWTYTTDKGVFVFNDDDKLFAERDKHTFFTELGITYNECNCNFTGYFAATNYVICRTGELADKGTVLAKYCKHFRQVQNNK